MTKVVTWLCCNLIVCWFYNLVSDDEGCHLALLHSLHSGGVPLQAPPKAAGKQEPESIYHMWRVSWLPWPSGKWGSLSMMENLSTLFLFVAIDRYIDERVTDTYGKWTPCLKYQHPGWDGRYMDYEWKWLWRTPLCNIVISWEEKILQGSGGG